MAEEAHSPMFTSVIDHAHAAACDAAHLSPLGGLPGRMPDIPRQEGLTPENLARALAGLGEPDCEDELGAIYDAWLMTLAARPRGRLPGPLPDAYRQVLRPLVDYDVTWSIRCCHDVNGDTVTGYLLPPFPNSVECDDCAAYQAVGIVRERQGWPCARCGVPSRDPAAELGGAFLVVPGTALARYRPKPAQIVIPVLLCAACGSRGGS